MPMLKSKLTVFIAIISTIISGCAEERLVEVVDLPPDISGVADITTEEDTPSGPLVISLIDEETEENGIALQVAVADTSLISETGISLTQDGQTFTLVFTPNEHQFGTTDVTLSALDSAGQETIETLVLNVTPVNDPPVADDQSASGLGTSTLPLVLRASDIENDPLTFRILEEPQYGTLEGDAPNLSYIPNADLTFVDTFTFVANDGSVDSNIATVTISVEGVNQPPLATPDTYDTIGGCAVVADASNGVLANDTDEDGDLLTASLMTPPNHGSLDLQADGSFIYAPSLPLHQSDSFSYTTSDGLNESAVQTVTITIDSDGIIVTTENDEMNDNGLCSLREAIQAANMDSVVDSCMAGAGNDRIIFGLGHATYSLTSAGAAEEGNIRGDLDLLGGVTIHGCGHSNTIIDGVSSDRVLDIQSDELVRIENVTIQAGLVTEGFGGGIRAQSPVQLAGVKFESNHAVGLSGNDGSSVGGGGGGGGAAGLGGAIYSFDTTVTLESTEQSQCLFVDNIASGGNGGRGKQNGGSFTGNGGRGGGLFGGSGGIAAAGNHGGYASGGGGGGGNYSGGIGGNGGFGGGGGGGGATTPGGNSGNGGSTTFGGGSGGIGCCSAAGGGGGGAALGGAVFSHGGALEITDCVFRSNVVSGGAAGANFFGGPAAQQGGSYGAAVFTYATEYSIDTSTVQYESNVAASTEDAHYHHP